ncbi:MAG: sulfite exporter TauE/SafE family protein [Planctomycetota bacterium]
MISMLVAVFTASLLGSLHCAGMCGPFCGVAVSGGASRGSAALLHISYHGGRLVTYTLLGIAAGTLGSLLDIASTLAGFQPIALALAGGMMMAVGMHELARLNGWRLPFGIGFKTPKAWMALLQRGQRFAATKTGVPRALTIGLLTTLLPCGWLYAFIITAAGSGGPLTGAAVMAVFWVGTLPVLLSLGVGVRRLAGIFGERLPQVTAAALLIVGLVTLTSRMQLSLQAMAQTLVTEATASETTLPDPDALPPCCRAKRAEQHVGDVIEAKNAETTLRRATP